MQGLISSMCLVNSSFGLWFSHYVWLFGTLWTVACQTPLSMGFSRQEYWSGLPFPSPGYHPNPRIEPGSLALWADSRVPLSIPIWKVHFLSLRYQHICYLLQLTQTTLNYYLNYYLIISIIVLVMCVCAQLCPTLCDPMDCSPPGSSVHGIVQARILEWVAISYSRGSSQPRNQTRVSCGFCIGQSILYHCTYHSML